MSKLAKRQSKTAIEYAHKCKDKNFADQMIAVYKNETTNAINSIIGMSRVVETMDRRYQDEEISKDDLDYFCLSIGLKKLSSQFRKFVCIGRHADKFTQYIDKMPQSISVLYEITTLDAELFETLLDKNLIYPNLSLSKLKHLAQKPQRKTSPPSQSLDGITITFEPDTLSEQSKEILILILKKVKQSSDLTAKLPSTAPLARYIKDELARDEIIDVASKPTRSQIPAIH